MTVRKAEVADVAQMVELSEKKRTEYETHQVVFWRKAKDSAEKQLPFFRRLVGIETVIAVVHEQDGIINGFLIATRESAPPVYDPGGFTFVVDDFVVRHPALWNNVGAALLDEAKVEAKKRGGVQIVVVSGHRDAPKRKLLSSIEFSIASDWWVTTI